MAIGEYKQAASTAILIASQEQKEGNYKVAHGILFETHQVGSITLARFCQTLFIPYFIPSFFVPYLTM
jgi:hypothetical protein